MKEKEEEKETAAERSGSSLKALASISSHQVSTYLVILFTPVSH